MISLFFYCNPIFGNRYKMGRKKDQQTDYLTRPLQELIIANLQQILQEFNLLNQRIDRIESQVYLSHYKKNKGKDFFTTEEVMEKLSISRGTLLSFRKAGKIGFTKTGNTVRFTKENIEAFKKVGSF